MEAAREPPWAEHEKVYLLAEILKAAPIPSHVLFNIIRDNNIQPRWNDMALPPGRSMHSSHRAFENLAAMYTGSDYRRPPLPMPVMYPGPDASKKRPLPQDMATPVGRLLQPRPPHPYPEYMSAGPAYASAMNPTGEPANKKKRGRPTKAEAQQRAQEAAARGEIYPPPRRGRVSMTEPPSESSPQGPEPRSHEQRTPPPSAPTQPSSTMTPQQQIGPEQTSESSSGKRRRTRPQPLELEKHRTLSDMESPLAYGSSSGDPARNQPYSAYTPISAPLASSTDSRDRDVRMEGVEDTQPRTTTPHSFKDTVGI
ncbi:hypothetical protein T440DRAFT_204242 [Plenodomus tracheiphilus IPT5]|uniref:Uncharacterized protein n=1 Tax=Plenodomus tracheiphilus IPT5 TaxID=1408161 RepID=A0A6A7BIA8_9PLEO|nr:hypothetical protein T440DRAFT_204242 [Plenodomus tracheiphilus IPT5]